MALIKCPECGKEISSSAKKCPHCGYSLSHATSKVVKWIVVILGIVTLIALALYGTGFSFSKTKSLEMGSNSMIPNILPGQEVIYDTSAYKNHQPKLFDVITLKNPDDESQILVERIIGLPGDTINIIDGKIYVGESLEPLDDSFVSETPVGSFGPYNVPDNCYFVLGDNRNYSRDSRYWINTFLEQENILGKVIEVK